MRFVRHALMGTVAGALFLTGSGADAQNPRFEQQVVVQGVAPSGGSDYHLTFSGPIALPGVALPPGRYLFARQAGHVIRVASGDGRHSYAMVHTIPTTRGSAVNRHEIVFGAPAADGAPARILAWFLPGEATGRQLLYPQR